MDLSDCLYLSPADIHFSQDSISNMFTPDSKGRVWRIGETLDELVSMKTFVTAIPPMYVVQFNDKWFSKNNRRLWVFRNLQLMKCIDFIPVRVNKGLPATQLTTLTGGKNVDIRGDHSSAYLKKFLSTQRATQLKEVDALTKPSTRSDRLPSHTYRPRFTAAIKNTPHRSSRTYQAIVRKYKQKLMMSRQDRERYKKLKATQKAYDFSKANTDKKPNLDFVSDTVITSNVFQFGQPHDTMPLTPLLSVEKDLKQVELFPATPMQYTDNFGFPNTPAMGVYDGVFPSTSQIPATPQNFSTIDESTNWADLDWPRDPHTAMDSHMACLRREYNHTVGSRPMDYGDYNRFSTPVPVDNIRGDMNVPNIGGKRKHERSQSPVAAKRRQHDDGSCHTVSSTTDVYPTVSNTKENLIPLENITRTITNTSAGAVTNTSTNARKKKTARRRRRGGGNNRSAENNPMLVTAGRVLYYDNYGIY